MKKEKNNKSAFLIFRVTSVEKQRLTQTALNKGFDNLSKYLRSLLGL